MSPNDEVSNFTRPRVTRRSVLEAAGGAVVGGTVAAGTATAQPAPGFDGWFAKTENYEGVVDETGTSSLTIAVGPGDVAGGPYAFNPAAVRVDPGTTVTWEWTGKGGSHNVVASDDSFESELTNEAGFTFEHTFEESGVYRYYCTPHKAMGMRGIVVVGDVTLADQGGAEGEGTDSGFSMPGNQFEQRFMAIFLSIMGFAVLLALLPEIGPATSKTKRMVSRIGYTIHRESGFRGRPLGSMIVGWLTLLLILTAMAVGAMGLWVVGLGITGFLASLFLLGVILVIYASSLADVGIAPSPASRRWSSTVGRSGGGHTAVRGAPNLTKGRFDVCRALPVLRGWLTVATLLVVAAVVPLVLWLVGGGPIGLLAGLLILGTLVAAYAVTETW